MVHKVILFAQSKEVYLRNSELISFLELTVQSLRAIKFGPFKIERGSKL